MSDEHTTEGSTRTEEFRISGEKLVSKVKEIIQAGNARRIIIKKPAQPTGGPEGEVVMEIPLTVAAVATILVPALVAVGAIAALAVEWVIVVEKQR